VLVQEKLGARNAFAFDVAAACAGSLYALTVADRFVAGGTVKKALVVGAELLTRLVDWRDRNTCVLFGDAAGAILLERSPDDARGILGASLHSDGAGADWITIRGPGEKVQMNGREVFKFAVRALEASAHELGVEPRELDHLIAHQANLRIIEAVCKRLEFPMDKVWINIDRYGNTSSASLPISLDEANRAGRFKAGDLVGLMAIGGGMAWGSALVRW
jgi:3-oxoacyl-[acyl-carrier-protein] synthase-3